MKSVLDTMAANPSWGARKIGEHLGISRDAVRTCVATASRTGQRSKMEPPAPKKSTPGEVVELAHAILVKRASTPQDLATAVGLEVSQIKELVERLNEKYCVEISGNFVALARPPTGRLELAMLGKDWVRFGLVSDTHLACIEERLEALHLQYDLFVSEGITTVFHAGNIVDGYVEKLNGQSVIHATVDGQIQYVIDNYPARPGITTYFITGADHDGEWSAKGVNFGKYLQWTAEDQGRHDLKYIGYVEADVELKTPGGSAIMKIQHPGGGSSYARSYTGQKSVESFEGGEKPAILVQGHYHVSNYMQERNVYVISMPGFQDQTVFARKKRLRMEVGGAILEFKQNPHDGSVTRCRVEFNRYFDRGYYRPFIRSDSKIQKGHLIINPVSQKGKSK